MKMNPGNVKALVFDVFGTVVDWRSSIIREGLALGRKKNIEDVDWEQFADAWRKGYRPAMDLVRSGESRWENIDTLHRSILDSLLVKFHIKGLSEAETDHFNRAWHRLDPWPDAVEGLLRLRRRYVVATLSNGNVALLVNMAKYAGLHWDCILSAELFRRYKPDPEVYQGAARLLGIRTDELVMVAAHQNDLRAAKAAGCKTAFIPRPLEYGADNLPDIEPDPEFDFTAKDFVLLAEQMGCTA
jgi:2-haloacid dehalogenase